MPRVMPGFVAAFEQKVTQALELATKVEAARGRLSGRDDRALLHPERMELIYEMAYFRVYLAWEEFLEQTFVRYLAGYSSAVYSPVFVQSSGPSSLATAWTIYLGGKKYKLWHDPQIVVQRSTIFLGAAPHEVVIQSAISDLQNFAAIRHRIAHAQENAKDSFNDACVALVGHKVKGAKAGHLLRRQTVSASASGHPVSVSWLARIANEYVSLAAQIA